MVQTTKVPGRGHDLDGGVPSASDTAGDSDPSEVKHPWLPVTIALVLIAAVWIGSCVISFTEQIRLAEHFRFEMAWLFPLIFDGLATALAVTSWSAALDGRHSPLLRLVTCAALSGSAWVNAAAVMERTRGDLDGTQVGMAVAAPIAAWIAFEFLLAELRRQIMRRRGEPAPVPVPVLRPVRVLLSPVRSVLEWRKLTLQVTDPRRAATARDRSGKATAPGLSLAPLVLRVPGPAARPADSGADTDADTGADNKADTASVSALAPTVSARMSAPVSAPLSARQVSAPARMSAPGQGRERMSAVGREPAPLPRMSAPDTTSSQAGRPERPPVSAPAASTATEHGSLSAPDTTDGTTADKSRKVDKRAGRKADTMSVSAAVSLLMSQGVTDADKIAERVPEIVGRDVPRATVTRTLRRLRSAAADTAADTDTHAGNYL